MCRRMVETWYNFGMDIIKFSAMCEVSKNLKLCTCNSDMDEIENVWMYARFVDGKRHFILGEPMVPNYINPATNKVNKMRITRMLNQRNCFDIEINHMDKDQLHLSFDKYSLFYSFEYRNNKWKSIQSEPLMVEWFHDVIHYGKMKDMYNI